VSRPAAAPFATDLLRAALGPALAAPYERAFGPVPWLTAGSLSWPADAAGDVLALWSSWAAGLPPAALTAIRVGGAAVAIDVAVPGDLAAELLEAPAGVCLGLRHTPAGAVLIGIAAAEERGRAVAAIDQVARALEEPVSTS
jgi:hypothetical protein